MPLEKLSKFPLVSISALFARTAIRTAIVETVRRVLCSRFIVMSWVLPREGMAELVFRLIRVFLVGRMFAA